MNRKHFWICLIGLHLLFMGKQIFYANSLIQDSKEYIYAADNMLENGTLYAWNMNHAFNEDWLTKRPVLYPAILAIFRTLSFGSSFVFFLLAYLFQNIASLVSIWLCLKIADRFALRFKWWHAILYMGLSLSQFIYCNLIMSEVYLQLCMTGIVYFLSSGMTEKKKILYTALLLIAGMSLKPVMMLTAFIFPAVYIVYARRKMKFTLLVISLLPLLYFFSVSAVNYNRSGYFHYSSISNINLLHYNTYSMLMYEYGVEKADSIIDEIRFSAKMTGTYKTEQEYIKNACTQLIRKDLPVYAYLHARGIVFSLLDPGRFDLTQFFQLPHSKNLIYETNKEGIFSKVLDAFMRPLGIVLLVLLLFNIFRFIICMRFIFSKQSSFTMKMILLMFPVYILGLTGPIGTSRFFMPLVPIFFLIFLFSVSKRGL